jgi:hypothetical protein
MARPVESSSGTMPQKPEIRDREKLKPHQPCLVQGHKLPEIVCGADPPGDHAISLLPMPLESLKNPELRPF